MLEWCSEHAWTLGYICFVLFLEMVLLLTVGV